MTQEYKNISIENFNYQLSEELIASHPLEERDKSRLLIAKDGLFSEDSFYNITKHLPSDSLIVFNDTKVVQARLIFYKKTGARIEIFCLDPAEGNSDIQIALSKTHSAKWNCLVGNAKKWKDGFLTIEDKSNSFAIKALLIKHEEEVKQVEFTWEPKELSFAEVLEKVGKTPLPPYITRNTIEEDKTRYQTIYANSSGSVAAPTAGLHFSENVLDKLKTKHIESAKLTLHVGAGTFKPVTAKSIGGHDMHSEQIIVSCDALKKIRKCSNENIISVGTTSVRTLETLYWWGTRLINEYNPKDNFFELPQWLPYEFDYAKPKIDESLDALIQYLENNNLAYIKGQTELIIVPGYEYMTTNVLITNFHQPKSTLLLLVAAFIGKNWKDAYRYATDNKFRFLSYGDGCLFFKE